MGISSLFDLSKSKSHLNPSKYCTITSPAVFFCSNSQFKSCSKEKCYKFTDSLAQSAVTIYEMFDRLQYFKVCRIFWTFFGNLFRYFFIWLSRNPTQQWKSFQIVNITKYIINASLEMSKKPSSNRSQCQLFYIHMVIQGRDYPWEYNYFKITCDCLFSHALGRCYEPRYKTDADLKNLFWHYDAGITTNSYM